jgi:hypothetical protein
MTRIPHKLLAACLWLVPGTAGPALAEVAVLQADHDATLIEDPAGALANGSGPVLTVGRNNQTESSIRRAVLRFDVAGALPRQAIVESVSLALFMQPSNATVRTLSLHRVLQEWGEGPSSSSGGGGVASQAGDATWIHTFYDNELWSEEGGLFTDEPRASLEVGDTGFWTWGTTPALEADVRLWAANPDRNFGWIVIGDEAVRQSAKSFVSREEADAALRPTLTITYRLPGSP